MKSGSFAKSLSLRVDRAAARALPGVFVKPWVVGALALAVAVGAGVAGCGSDSSPTTPQGVYTPPPSGSGMGLLAVSLNATGSVNDPSTAASTGQLPQDPARTSISALWVTFDSIRVFPACDDSAGDDSTGNGDDSTFAASPWHGLSLLGDEGDSTGEGDDSTHTDCDYIEVLTDSITVDVAGLDTTLTSLLGTLDLPQGRYTHLALHVADAWVITQDGDSVQADLPGRNDLLKVIFPFTIADGQVTDIVIVFDLDRSIVETPPGSGNFKVKPVLHGAWGPHDHDHDSDFGHENDQAGMHGNPGGNGNGNSQGGGNGHHG
jgi:hypothetical protein